MECPAKDKQGSGNGLIYNWVNSKIFRHIREVSVSTVDNALYSPHSELALGMIVGLDLFDHLPIFSQVLRNTGTIHVVVVSGYNINLVFNLIIKLVGSPYKKRNILIASFMTLGYSLLSGFEPPVIRAWIMGFILIFIKYYGLRANALYILLFAAILIIIISPSFLFNLSFQLSFLATLSLIYFSEDVKTLITRFIKYESSILDDLYSSLSVQVILWPFLSYKFGLINPLSPFINCLILWTVPISTILGGLFLIIGLIWQPLGVLLFRSLYIPLDIFVTLTEFFDKIPTKLLLKIPLGIVIIYYIFISLYLLRRSRHFL
ncbi:hypothetical protein A2V49_02670 [candidate division WWE3 bacterium RBG_19FT_COMBO_34_6]|uniref:ComEC/Rec2-related protein domain-containing protein n=1 Tax=candidate division WWE3 bacterium RBG_19FT_COMBO_34_6 TaxID=1802612 RepID=A0A1F4UKH8_UNCKA|nr:MAG: hypothetical protein A2V49_02670 [candidate division WWE3 bacterium RBG_19FT_COMBO_34_6]